MAERKIYRPEEKLKILMEGLSGTVQISDLCRRYGINTRQFYLWKKKLVNSTEIFNSTGRKNTSQEREIDRLREENSRLKDTIAEIASENLELKKKIGQSGQGRVRT